MTQSCSNQSRAVGAVYDRVLEASMKTALAIVAIGLVLAPLPAFAHHSFAAEFDANKPIVVQGTVTKVEWTNPHIWIYVDMKDAGGKIETWQCEGGSPNTLTRQGWRKATLKTGDNIVIAGSMHK